MSSPHLPSQANSGYQQRTVQPLHTLAPAPAPRPQTTVLVRVESVLTIGQAAVGQSELCEHFAEVCTNTYQWTPISAADVQRLSALNIPAQIVLSGVPSGDSSFTGNEPEQRYVSKSSSTISRWYRTLHTLLELSRAPHSQHRLSLRTTASLGPALFNHRSRVRTSQPRASEMITASYVGANQERRRISEHNRTRRWCWIYYWGCEGVHHSSRLRMANH